MSSVLTQIDGETKLEIIQEDNKPNAVQEEPQCDQNPILQSLISIVDNK